MDRAAPAPWITVPKVAAGVTVSPVLARQTGPGESFEDRPPKEILTNRVSDRLTQVNTQTQRYLTEANDGEARVAGLLSDYKSLLQEMQK